MSAPAKTGTSPRWVCISCGELYDTEQESDRCFAAHEKRERLRDASADLYEALRGMVAWFHCQQQRAPLEQAEAALRKADGQ